jgi:hypothetical protein
MGAFLPRAHNIVNAKIDILFEKSSSGLFLRELIQDRHETSGPESDHGGRRVGEGASPIFPPRACGFQKKGMHSRY